MCSGALDVNTNYTCSCQSGYTLAYTNGASCSPINRCLTNNGGCNQNCIFDGPDVSHCSCNAGFTSSNLSCLALNICSVNNGNCSHNCIYDGPGNFHCECNFGYSASNSTCNTVNVCDTNNGGCSHVCSYAGPGIATCYCNTGYSASNTSCNPMNNCLSGNGGCDQNCNNFGPGISYCTCNIGYISSSSTCTAINNCLTNNGGCDQKCFNTGPGTSKCACNAGYTSYGTVCVPVNNCQTNNGGCDQTCTNDGPGISHCTCGNGYTGTTNCLPINKCLTSNGGCQQKCVFDGPDSSHCDCNFGYTMSSDNNTCTAINNCNISFGGCSHKCINDGPGLSHCSCNSGYSLYTDGKGCIAIHNCDTANGNCSQICYDQGPGLSKCGCNAGYVLSTKNQYDCESTTVNASPSSSAAILGGAVGGSGFAILLVLLLVIILLRRRRNQERNRAFDFNKLVDANTTALTLGEKRIVPMELKRTAIEMITVLGKGAFGEVSKAKMTESNGKFSFLVAVKVLHRSNAESLAARESLLNEASLMAQFSHDNVVLLVGVVTAGEPLLVVLEFCELGALNSYLEKNELAQEIKLKIAIDCANGMQYLASLHFVHRDLASRNVLLDSSMTGKIADFGMSRENEENKEYYASKGGALPIRWTAPEALEHRKFSEKSDVWSFGILLYEIWTRALLPYSGMTNDKVWIKVTEGYRLPCPPECLFVVYELMKSCWLEPNLRPNFATLYDSLLSVLDPLATEEKIRRNASDGNEEIGGKVANAYEMPTRALDYTLKMKASNGSQLTYMVPDDEAGFRLTYMMPEDVPSNVDVCLIVILFTRHQY